MKTKKIGVLALQGDFYEHAQILRFIGAEATEVRLPEQLKNLDGLIIPGGESTTFGKLATEFKLIEPLRAFCVSGKPVLGTCAGMIFLAKDVGLKQPVLGLMDVKVKRNAFGRQVDSFETDLQIPVLEPKGLFHAVFIRAPLVESVGKGVEVLAKLDDGTIVAVQQGNLMATSFHPELTQDTRLHRYWLSRATKP
ncbi:MAG: pyridoxal 5'-phosphate synthase glutaminase subunit PdxT [Chloroflexi bacterium]|nr:pyridoxal 5'-phosphate synthase glutaminase subunit PdxT [Chloroflexota bacterium]